MALQDPWERMNSNQRMFALVLIFTLLTGILAGGYAISKSKNEVICLSCLALNPAGDFSGSWWVTYPAGSPMAGVEVNHPALVTDSLENYDLVILYFWQPGCSACSEQWDAMGKDGLVSGPEASGSMAWKADQVKLHSVDATVDRNTFTTYANHASSNRWATPMTVFVAENEGQMLWFARIGIMSPAEVRNVILDAL